MAKFRKKPVVIEAFQWFKNGDHPRDGEETFVSDGVEYRCEGKIVRYFRRPEPEYAGDSYHSCGNTWHVHGWIDTLEGGHTVCPGDWIITGVAGEDYPCKPDIFLLTYDPTHEDYCAYPHLLGETPCPMPGIPGGPSRENTGDETD